MEASDPPVAAILERAGGLTSQEVAALAAALRANPPALDIGAIVDEHQRWLNQWAMFDQWPHPVVEMRWARERVDAALGLPPRSHASPEPEPDDGTVAWGAGTAVALAVLAAGRARYSAVEDLAPLGAAWEADIGAPDTAAENPSVECGARDGDRRRADAPLLPLPDMWELARDGACPVGDPGPAGPYGPNSAAVESLIRHVTATSLEDFRRVSETVIEQQRGLSHAMAWRDAHLAELERAARDAGLEDAVHRAWFDALRAAVRACEDRMNAELFFLHYWNLATESTFTESAGLAAVAIALGEALSSSTRLRLLLPWMRAEADRPAPGPVPADGEV